MAPHQPRLDWQMWFAALNPKREEAWFMRLAQCIRFTTREERARTGRWWERKLVGAYTRPLSPWDPGSHAPGNRNSRASGNFRDPLPSTGPAG